MLAWLAASFAATEASAVAEASSACEALNVQRNIDTHRTGQVTKAVLCDTQPAPCVSEFLFSHEVYWSEARARRDGSPADSPRRSTSTKALGMARPAEGPASAGACCASRGEAGTRSERVRAPRPPQGCR